MLNAELYEISAELPNKYSKEVIDDYKHKIKWRTNGCDRVMDVGCGTASSLMKYIHPLLPASFEALVGVDISGEMVQFCREKYKDYKKCTFEVLDLTTQQMPEELCGKFDHVTSFFALQWMHDQKTTLTNIHKLLRSDGGDCLFVIIISTTIYDIYLIMRTSPKWAPHMVDVDTHIAQLYYSKDPVKEYADLLTAAGFRDHQLEVRNRSFTFENSQQMKDLVKSVCPLAERMSAELQEEFLNEFLHIAEIRSFSKWNTDSENSKITFNYELLAVYTQKPNEHSCKIF